MNNILQIKITINNYLRHLTNTKNEIHIDLSLN